MIKRTLRSTVTINKVTQKAPLTMDPLRTHVRTAASPTAKSLRTHRNNSQRDASDAVWVCGSGRTGRLRCVVLGEQDNQCVRFWENRKTKVCGSRKTGQPRRVALGEKDNQGVWVWENRTTKVRGSGRTGKQRCVVPGEQDNQGVRLWENRTTKVCGSGRTGQPRCVALGEQDNQGVWLWENRTTKVCGSGRTGQPRPLYPFHFLFPLILPTLTFVAYLNRSSRLFLHHLFICLFIYFLPYTLSFLSFYP